MKIAFTKVKLKGLARIWWQSIENSELAFGHHILQWEDMKRRLKQNFLASDYIDSLHKGYLSLQQGAYFLDEYTNIFRECIVRCNLRANDGLIINKCT